MEEILLDAQPGDAIALVQHGAGQKFLIEYGPFQGLEGSMVEEQSSRVVLSVQLVRSRVLVEMDQDWIRPLPECAAAAAAGGR